MRPFVVAFRSAKPLMRVDALLGEEPPTPTGGGGGWEAKQMAQRAPVVVWTMRPELIAMTIPIVLDNFAAGESVGSDIDTLVRMWRPKDDEDEPPILTVHGEGNAVPFQHLKWVMTGLEWGAAQANDHGNRTQQRFVVTLTEYRPDERLQAEHGPASKRRKKKKKRGKAGGKGPTTYTVKAGDTLVEIAQRELGDRNKWREIADLNDIKDPRNLRVGQKLRLPG